MKKCSVCCEEKPKVAYYKNCRSSDGLQKHCKTCHKIINEKWRKEHIEEQRKFGRESMARWRLKNPERVKELNHKYRILNKEKYSLSRSLKNRELKQRIVVAYGGKCECCKEPDYRFLCIDHKNNNGYFHRKVVHGGVILYRWLIKNNFPKDFCILCFNCNFARAFYGGREKICPHKLSEAKNIRD